MFDQQAGQMCTNLSLAEFSTLNVCVCVCERERERERECHATHQGSLIEGGGLCTADLPVVTRLVQLLFIIENII
jgi:hypothetical protein